MMNWQRVRQRGLVAMMMIAMTWSVITLTGTESVVHGQDKKKEKEKDPLEGKKGTALGTLVTKDKAFIELKADGEEMPRRYVPEWVGGNPAQGGGPDKKILKIFSELTVGSRLEVEWVYHERLRALNVKVLKKADNKK